MIQVRNGSAECGWRWWVVAPKAMYIHYLIFYDSWLYTWVLISILFPPWNPEEILLIYNRTTCSLLPPPNGAMHSGNEWKGSNMCVAITPLQSGQLLQVGSFVHRMASKINWQNQLTRLENKVLLTVAETEDDTIQNQCRCNVPTNLSYVVTWDN